MSSRIERVSKYDFNNESDFELSRGQAEAFYRSLDKKYCAYFQRSISFNSNGWEHLRFKNRGHPRSHADQYTRFKLLPLVPKILGLSRTIQGIYERNQFERIRLHNRTEDILKAVSYFEFIAVTDDVRVKVILKQIEASDIFFWSVIPYWKYDPYSTNKRLLYSRDPESL